LENVEVVNRSSGRLDYFKKRGIPAYSWEEFIPKSYDLVVNTTSAGLTDNSLPLPEPMAREVLKRAKYLVDIIYGKETPIMKLAKEMVLQVKGGEEMLIYQGVLAMEHFLNRPLPREKVASLYREILRG
jgi:shikimate dehydrogenase